MTDFYAQLEEQLLLAGRRRAGRGRARQALSGRGRPLLMAATVLGAIAAGAVTLPSLLSPSSEPAAPSAPPQQLLPPATAVSLRSIDVAVLNGTVQSGAARGVAEQLERRGATIRTVGNAADQRIPRTLVFHYRGSVSQARRVAAVLGVAKVRGLGSYFGTDADVVVFVGADRPRSLPAPAPPLPGRTVTVPPTKRSP